MRTGLWIGNSLGLAFLCGVNIISTDWLIGGVLNSGILLFLHWTFMRE